MATLLEGFAPIAVEGLFNPLLVPGVSAPLLNLEPSGLFGVAVTPVLLIAVDGL